SAKITPVAQRPATSHFARPIRVEKLGSVLQVGQLNLYLRDMRVFQEVGAQFCGRFSDEDDTEILSAHVRRGCPFQQGDQGHSLVRPRTCLILGRNDLLRKIYDEGGALRALRSVGKAEKESTEERSESNKLPGCPGFVKIGIFDPIERLEPF